MKKRSFNFTEKDSENLLSLKELIGVHTETEALRYALRFTMNKERGRSG